MPAEADTLTGDALVVRNLRAGYGALAILFGMELAVAPGEFISLVGPNGAGKSTLLKTIFGMTTITGGAITWAGRTISGSSRARSCSRESPSYRRDAVTSR